ncbi:hypothetical protein CXB51_010223 [Gossypium anomalum]|uniref:Reverse transcriptase Ty1/copia-type domain-containing protein n=1 Tax=Gossypium anomalum TaxID=47600 RepID=A0A8J5Z2M5_9ROSI|nr:hypothetical protein CXB51_010223 [Gossypium anomalum]
MIAHSTLPESLWGEALKIATYILNRGFLAEAMPYRPHEKKLDSKTVRDVAFEEELDSNSIPTITFDDVQVFIPIIDQEVNLELLQDNVEQLPIQNEVIIPEEQTQQPQEQVPLRRPTRERRNVISDDFIVFLQEYEDDNGMMEDDPINFHQAMKSFNSKKWIDAMKDEYKSMKDNKVWKVVPLPEDAKPIGCKWIFKTKRYANGNVESCKARLIAKGYTQKECIDFTKTFSLVSSKDSFRISMVLVAHFDLELHQMDVKTTFLNGDIEETIYMEFRYIEIDLESYRLGDTHAAKGDKFSLTQCPKSDLEIQEMQKVPYASTIESLMYAQVCTRPDIMYIVGMLGRYLSDPSIDYWIVAKRVIRYIQRTKDYMLTYKRSDLLEVVGYSDFDFTECQDSRKSTSGYIYLLARRAISWKSVKQTRVASSTMAAEFVACYEASNHEIWLQNFVTGLCILENVERPLKLFCDNKSAVLYSNNNRNSSKSKHIDIKFLVVKERVQNGQISIEHTGTNSMIADPLTKGLSPKDFHEYTVNMGVKLFEDIMI